MTGWAPISTPLDAFVETPLGARETVERVPALQVDVAMLFMHGWFYDWHQSTIDAYNEQLGEWQGKLEAEPGAAVGGVVLNMARYYDDALTWFPLSPPGAPMFDKVAEYQLGDNWRVPGSVTLDNLKAAYRAAVAIADPDGVASLVRLRIGGTWSQYNYWSQEVMGGDPVLWWGFRNWLLSGDAGHAVVGWQPWEYRAPGLQLEEDVRLATGSNFWPSPWNMLWFYHPIVAPVP